MKMNNHPGATGQRGRESLGDPERRGVNKPKPTKRTTVYTSNTEVIKNNMFKCRKPKHAATFKKSIITNANLIVR